ncbi:SGNH/GDSL hydrolase family protein [Actinocrinis puniceicyclus]|uniref:SGNH/GDSL hydrolase family protein n=1 Tax=Actinocrinis puniceicyclus TaxID=977794 RepID=A0A8J7WXW3_9ACTN|nr:SGNH/GDSL hydrolase family protein [Actinocrinis puniceicyclus]MBS2967114.1 SGNH/GDSL hydrolase family protein [Actinocrinis puniceicyclus]
MTGEDAGTAGVYGAEAADPFCLRAGEARALLRGHPWRRFAVLGDSIARGVGDAVAGYPQAPLADRVAALLAAEQPALGYLNLGERGLRTRQVRERQLGAALAFAPDLALLVCGANDALRPGYERRAEAVDADAAAIVRALQGAGALVVTFSVFVWSSYPGLPVWLTPPPAERMAWLGRRAAALAAELGTVHVDLAGHPAAGCRDMVSADGLHSSARGQSIAAAETVRRLGARVRAAAG